METNETNEEVTIEDPKAVLSALERAKSDAQKYREKAEALQVDLDSKDQAIAEYSGKLLREKIKEKLATEGIKDPARVMKFINTAELSFDDEFNVVGFDDQYEQLKNDLPEVFDAKLRVGGQADSATKTSVSTQITATEMQAMKILGKI